MVRSKGSLHQYVALLSISRVTGIYEHAGRLQAAYTGALRLPCITYELVFFEFDRRTHCVCIAPNAI